MIYKFRDLTASEIECRIAQIKANGLSLLLYKDARVDQNVLDETVKPENWQRDHKELKGNIYCGISIWDEDKKMWITKWDAGKESYTESEKGEASDSFKRAGFNWGIGRELYTSPFIWVTSTKCKIEKTNKVDKYNNPIYKCDDKFEVTKIVIENKEIVELEIINKTTGVICFEWSKKASKIDEPIKDGLLTDNQAKGIYSALVKKLGSNEAVVEYLMNNYNVENTSKLMKSQYAEIVRQFK